MGKIRKRCVNLDWVEVYCLEDRTNYPCNADYFRSKGYFVTERDYGTRQYAEMFVIEGSDGEPWIEVRRNPCSGDSSFSGLQPESCHLRLTNRACYSDDPIGDLRNFLLKHNYQLQRIFRLDVCYDFEEFDTHDKPAKFAKRYFQQVYRKINQCKVHCYGDDSWSDFEWESISWGNPKSMVSTKMYNKTKELKSFGWKKPYIIWHWWLSGLIDDPIKVVKRDDKGNLVPAEIWRIEFSLRSPARNWIAIEDNSGKKPTKTRIPHTLGMFDSRDKLWQRFQDLAYHYFHFKYREYKHINMGATTFALSKAPIPPDAQLKRKDLCKDKVLFYWDEGREFYKVEQLPKDSRPIREDEFLKRHLILYRQTAVDPKIISACDTLIESLTKRDWLRLTQHISNREYDILRKALQRKLACPEEDIIEIIQQLREVIEEIRIW